MKLYLREPASLTLLPCSHLGITHVSNLKYFQHSVLVSHQSFAQLYWHTIMELDDPEL